MLPDDSSRNVTANRADGTAAAPPTSTTSETGDDVETALARALAQAAAVGRFDIVSQLARELEARRLAHAGNVVRLDARERGKR